MKYREEGLKDQMAHTLEPEQVFGPGHRHEVGPHSYTHASGWTISGSISEDYYYWVNDFEATHPVHGWVKGNFEDFVEAKSKRGFDHFIANHPPHTWDYWDI